MKVWESLDILTSPMDGENTPYACQDSRVNASLIFELLLILGVLFHEEWIG